jgi:hypothetical protein
VLEDPPPHLHFDPVPARLQREAGAGLARPPLGGFTLATYVHLLPEDLPEPDFLDDLLLLGSSSEATGSSSEATTTGVARTKAHTAGSQT